MKYKLVPSDFFGGFLRRGGGGRQIGVHNCYIHIFQVLALGLYGVKARPPGGSDGGSPLEGSRG